MLGPNLCMCGSDHRLRNHARTLSCVQVSQSTGLGAVAFNTRDSKLINVGDGF